MTHFTPCMVWFKSLFPCFSAMVFLIAKFIPTYFFKTETNIPSIYVDTVIIIGSNTNLIQEIIHKIDREFAVKDLRL